MIEQIAGIGELTLTLVILILAGWISLYVFGFIIVRLMGWVLDPVHKGRKDYTTVGFCYLPVLWLVVGIWEHVFGSLIDATF